MFGNLLNNWLMLASMSPCTQRLESLAYGRQGPLAKFRPACTVFPSALKFQSGSRSSMWRPVWLDADACAATVNLSRDGIPHVWHTGLDDDLNTAFQSTLDLGVSFCLDISWVFHPRLRTLNFPRRSGEVVFLLGFLRAVVDGYSGEIAHPQSRFGFSSVWSPSSIW